MTSRSAEGRLRVPPLMAATPSFIYHPTSFAMSTARGVLSSSASACHLSPSIVSHVCPPHGSMSLTVSRLFTISTYDPPSTPIALTAQQSGKKQAEKTLPPEGELSSKKSSPAGSGDVWGNLRRTEATPPVRSKSVKAAMPR